jgi:hypothetical protein
MAMLQRLGQVAGQIEINCAPVRCIEHVQSVIDAQERKMTIIAPQAQLLGFGRLAFAVRVVPGENDAMQSIENFIPGPIADLFDHDRLGFSCGQTGGNASRPQTATMPFVAADIILTENADANGGSATRHGGLLSSIMK